ncbi:MAG: ornithine aminotransferase [Gemmatimonadetes bacterium]|jgi:osmotically-inducible protein OsmY|nr:ornithine aminotransferase [Gemmatimonadota bacterium]
MTLKDSIHILKEDHEIHTDVRAELKMDLDVTDERDVEITVDHGLVDLDGSADSYAQKWAIERATYRVVGVKAVRNYLDVKPSKDDYRDDGEIEKAAKRSLEWDARVPDGIRATVTDGLLQLHGTVARFSQREAAEEAVRNLLGVREVTNDIKLSIAEAASDLKRDIEDAIRRRFDGTIANISVEAVGGVVTLNGIVPTFAVRDDIERAIWSAPGVTRIDDQLQVA